MTGTPDRQTRQSGLVARRWWAFVQPKLSNTLQFAVLGGYHLCRHSSLIFARWLICILADLVVPAPLDVAAFVQRNGAATAHWKLHIDLRPILCVTTPRPLLQQLLPAPAAAVPDAPTTATASCTHHGGTSRKSKVDKHLSSMPFGQLVIGPPGSGKTTYCNGMQQYLRSIGRKVAIVNLDPANDTPPYQPDVDAGELVTLDSVMQHMQLGPNGGLVYCMDYLQQNLDWLHDKLQQQASAGVTYFIFDCPGQVELFTNHPGFKSILDALTTTWHYRLTAVHLVDAHLCSEPSKYISALLLSLNVMLHLELPHVNVLSKVDLLPAYGDLAFNLDFYTQVQDLSYLVEQLGGEPSLARFKKLSKGLCEVVEDYGLVSFVPLSVQDQKALEVLLSYIDKANGTVYAALERPQDMPLPPAFVYSSAHRAADEDVLADLMEQYVQEVKERVPAVHPELLQEPQEAAAAEPG